MPPRRQPKAVVDEPVVAPQGLSSKFFGLFKKIPMAMSSPTKATDPSEAFEEIEHDESDASEGGSESEHEGESDSRSEDEDEDRVENEDEEMDSDGLTDNMKQEEDKKDQEEVQEEAEEDQQCDDMGHEQFQAILENYLLETSTRTHLLRTRIRTQFVPALRRRFAFELSRITPSIAHVTAREYHERDKSVLRNTMEFVARLAVEQKGYQIGMKRQQSGDEMAMSEMEKTFRKRKRLLTDSHSTTASSSQLHPPLSLKNGEAGPSSKRHNRKTKPRPARRNESLVSVNGSPVSAPPPIAPPAFSGEFTFVRTAKWAEVERALGELDIRESDKKKLNEMFKSLKMDVG